MQVKPPIRFLRVKPAMTTLCLLGCLGGMFGCASRPSPELVKVSRSSGVVPEFYVVQRGDTVSKIAARYGLSYPEIGAMNQLDSAFTIYPNQRLRLRSAGSSRAAAPRAPVARPVNTMPVQPSTPIRTQPLPATPSNAAISAGTATPQTARPRATTWQWPSPNPILQDFNLSAQVKGIRFAGKSGDPVVAAAAGEVVYANNGLTEYGNLVLLRHADGFITAYAHNQRLLVQEGQTVDIGQPIAVFGDSGTSRVMLEFQVRKNGKPVDPKQVLPSR